MNFLAAQTTLFSEFAHISSEWNAQILTAFQTMPLSFFCSGILTAGIAGIFAWQISLRIRSVQSMTRRKRHGYRFPSEKESCENFQSSKRNHPPCRPMKLRIRTETTSARRKPVLAASLQSYSRHRGIRHHNQQDRWKSR